MSVISSQAAVLTVSTTADAGIGSLRQAIIDANINAAANTVNFSIPLGDPGFDPVQNRFTISLLSPLPDLPLAPLTLNNNVSPAVTVKGNNTFRIFKLVNSAVVVINNLTISNGSSGAGLGGGILMGNSSTLTLNGSTVSSNASAADGPATITNLGCTPAPDQTLAIKPIPESRANASARVVRVVSANRTRGGKVTVEIEMTAQGNEAGTQFGLHFDPTALSISDVSGVNVNPDITLGADAPQGTTLNVNAAAAANGNIGIVENFNGAADSITAISEGARRIARVTFHVAPGAVAGESKLTFDASIISNVTADTNGLLLTATYDQTGRITIPAAAGVSVSGRVTTPNGQGLRNASVTIVDRAGFARTVTTSSFGYYQFDDIAIGETYTIGVASRAYRFASRTVEATDNLADVDFVGRE